MLALTHAPSARLADCALTHLQRRPIDWRLAVRQHAAYRQALSACGVQVLELDVNRQFPDCPFVEDLAVVLDEVAIIATMGAPSRQGEVAGVQALLATRRPLRSLQRPATLEGGDVLRVKRDLLVGLSSRTNQAGVDQLTELTRPFGYRVWPVRVTGCLHLKTACTAIDDECLLVHSAWLAIGDLPAWQRQEAPEPWGANVLRIGDRLVCPAGHQQTIALLENRGLQVIPVDLSEFAKAEAGTTCLSLLVAE